MSKKVRKFFQSVRIFPTVFVRIFEKVIWEHCLHGDEKYAAVKIELPFATFTEVEVRNTCFNRAVKQGRRFCRKWMCFMVRGIWAKHECTSGGICFYVAARILPMLAQVQNAGSIFFRNCTHPTFLCQELNASFCGIINAYTYMEITLRNKNSSKICVSNLMPIGAPGVVLWRFSRYFWNEP